MIPKINIKLIGGNYAGCINNISSHKKLNTISNYNNNTNSNNYNICIGG